VAFEAARSRGRPEGLRHRIENRYNGRLSVRRAETRSHRIDFVRIRFKLTLRQFDA
jgi:hypothetical protein